MSEPRDLRDLLADAVAYVEPADRLGEIRERVAAPRRTPWLAVGAATLGVAATVAAVAGVTLFADDRPDAGLPATSTTAVDPTAGQSPSYAVYYVGDTDRGPRLFREWRTPDRRFADALSALSGDPDDGDYRTLWSTAALMLVGAPDSDVATVRVADGQLAERPPGVTAEEARLAVQQVVYTVRGAHPHVRTVEFEFDGPAARTVFGLPGTRFSVEPESAVRASVNISDPIEGRVVSGTFTARGSANVVEGTVTWELRQGGSVVREGFTTAAGSSDRHHPWETVVDVSDLPPGAYTFEATSDDSSDGEGFDPDVDTRTVVVE
jgi:hypothetical protein